MKTRGGLGILALTLVSRAGAQAAPDASPFLLDWAEHTWLHILDRSGAAGGRFSSNEVLLRFRDRIDEEYRLDLLATRFTHAEQADWYGAANGARWRAGSVTKRDMATVAETKARVPLGERWSFGIRLDLEENVQVDRAFVRARFERSIASRYFAYAEGSLEPEKAGSDLEFGAGWRRSGPRPASGRVSVAVLDWANDLIYVSLHAAGSGEIESTLVYDRQPLAVRGAFDILATSDLRLAVQGGYARPSVLRMYRGEMPDSGFRLWERIGFAGGLIAWNVMPPLQVGAVATYLSATSERTRLSPSVPTDEFDQRERTAEFGALISAHLGRWVYLDGIGLRIQRWERRDNRTTPILSVDYADRSWTGELLVTRRPPRGVMADVGVLFDLRDVDRGAGQLPGWSARVTPHQWRARADLGWRFGPQAAASVGSAFDLDGDGVARRFDGIRGRFVMSW